LEFFKSDIYFLSEMSWSTTTKEKKPRKKPVAKRIPVPKPEEELTPLQIAVYHYLVKQYPRAVNCEDIMAGVIRSSEIDEKDVTIKAVWDVMDDGAIHRIVNSPQWNFYVINTE
jgi:hypothetical protein